MNAQEVCQGVQRSLGALFGCEQKEGLLRIRTPFLYPDGDVVDVFFHSDRDIAEFTDLGETMRWLHMQTYSTRRSAKQSALIHDVCQNQGVEFYRGALVARVRPQDDPALVLVRVAEAAVRVSDLWFTFRTRSVGSVTEEVSDYLAEREVPFERGPRLVGRSGKVWTVDFHVRAARRSSLVCVLGTGSRAAARAVVNQVVATWYDINHLTVGPEALQFISLFDDTVDVWSVEDFRLVEQLSTVAHWSKPEELLDLLVA